MSSRPLWTNEESVLHDAGNMIVTSYVDLREYGDWLIQDAQEGEVAGLF